MSEIRAESPPTPSSLVAGRVVTTFAVLMMIAAAIVLGISTAGVPVGVLLMIGAMLVAILGLVMLSAGLRARGGSRGLAWPRTKLVLLMAPMILWIAVTVASSNRYVGEMSAPFPGEPDGKFTDTSGILLLFGGCGFFLLVLATVPGIVILVRDRRRSGRACTAGEPAPDGD